MQHNRFEFCANQSFFNETVEQKRQQGFTHLPVIREMLADMHTPVSTYLKLANQPYSYLFESVQGGNEWGRFSIIGLPCEKVYRFENTTLIQEKNGHIIAQETVTNPLSKIDELQQSIRVDAVDNMPDVLGGLVGYFGYETIRYIEPKIDSLMQQKPLKDPVMVDDIVLMESTDVVVFDNLLGRVYVVSLADTSDPNSYQLALNKIQLWQKKLQRYVQEATLSMDLQPDIKKIAYRVHSSKEDFSKAVHICREYIKQGDIMQVVLSQRLSAEFNQDAFQVYRALRTINPSPHMYYLRMKDYEIIGSSPEILVKKQENTITVRPIAGTRKRGKNAEEDIKLAQELRSDKKECAEHVMLIDLGRNDVGRLAIPGTVQVTENMQVEKYSHVMHLVSNVQAKVDEKVNCIDVLRATFPAGTVSGAPKIRAMQIIHELEPEKRGIYSGAVGYLSWQGSIDTAIAIRTAVVKDNTIYIQAGAGIVADSVAEYEWKETMKKSHAILSALAMVLQNNEGDNAIND